ncbi:hypothetical protein DFP72DRAFT_1045599 [Ephemerocybe angulata]|uniref:Uncharacterized protein n=1 Tax=Ephemerocybe angulata TaxID=980116 RepID=A0A8H6HYX8_9AGAR|nr:hypothetical protein DFP72DRAFT_1045599 [Tulosesus angulatus]
MPPGRPKLYHTQEEKLSANRSKSNNYYARNKAKIITARRRMREKASRNSGGEVVEVVQPLVPKRSELEIAMDHLPRVSARYDRLLNDQSLHSYLTNLCEQYAARHDDDDLHAASHVFHVELIKIEKIMRAVAKYQHLVLNLDGVTERWKQWEALRLKLRALSMEIEEIDCEACMGPGQMVIDFRNKALRFQKM